MSQYLLKQVGPQTLIEYVAVIPWRSQYLLKQVGPQTTRCINGWLLEVSIPSQTGRSSDAHKSAMRRSSVSIPSQTGRSSDNFQVTTAQDMVASQYLLKQVGPQTQDAGKSSDQRVSQYLLKQVGPQTGAGGLCRVLRPSQYLLKQVGPQTGCLIKQIAKKDVSIPSQTGRSSDRLL